MKHASEDDKFQFYLLGYWFCVPDADICVDLSYRAEVPLLACVIICYGFALLTPPPKYV